jgi:hypothetical protein
MLLLLATQRSDADLALVGVIAGFVIGTLGHITRIRWLILLGILLIAVSSVLFSFGVGRVD